jgi:hypothetical protein
VLFCGCFVGSFVVACLIVRAKIKLQKMDIPFIWLETEKSDCLDW